MKASKKILSLFLAVVMVVTTCSVGFTAFAQETNPSYWSDKDNTNADTAFESLNNLVDYFVPTILNIEIEQDGVKKTLGSLLGITDVKDADLSAVVEGASPLLMGLLGVAKASDVEKQAIITKHLGETTYKSVYNRYFSYLDNSSNQVSFFDLYQFCKSKKTSSTDVKTLGGWCNVTLTKLDKYLDYYLEAAGNQIDADKAYAKLTAGKTLEETESKTYNGVKYKDLTDAGFKKGVANAQAFFTEMGIDLTITNPAEALYYYYSANATNFIDGVIAVKLASGEISNSKIKDAAATEKKFTPANLMEIINENYAAYAATKDTGTLSISDFIDQHADLITGGYNDIAGVKNMTAEEASNAGYKFSDGSVTDLAVPTTGWPTYVSSLPRTSSTAVKSDPYYSYGADYTTARSYYYINPADGKVYKTLKNNVTAAQEAIAKPYYDAYIANNSSSVNPVELYGEMLKLCYMDINDTDVNLGVYRSSSYEKMVKNALKETGLYTDVDASINSAKITDEQIKAASEYFIKLNETKDASYKDFIGFKNDDEEVTGYLNTGDNAFSAEATAFLKTISNNTTYQALVIALLKGGDDAVTAFKAVAYNSSPYNLHGVTTVYDVANFSVSSRMLYNYIGSDKIGDTNTSFVTGKITANVPAIYHEIYKYNQFKDTLNTDEHKFVYEDDLAIPGEFAVSVVNAAINGYINDFLDPTTNIGGIIDKVLAGLLQTDVDLHSILIDVWENLANDPIATVFKLLPVLTIVLDELLIPILFNNNDDANANLVLGLLGAKEGDMLYDKALASGDTSVGITDLSFDLNQILPAILTWFDEEDKDVAFDKVKAIVGTYADERADGKSYAEIVEVTTTIENEVEVKHEKKIDGSTVLAFTGIYVADKAIMGASLGNSFVNLLKKKNVNEDVAKGLNEIVVLLAGIARDAVDEYIAEQEANPDIKWPVSGDKRATEGLNDIFVSLPDLVDRIGKKLLVELDVKCAEDTTKPSDWSYAYDGKFVYEQDKQDKTVKRNAALEAFKATSSANDGAAVLDAFVNIFIGDILNSVLDLANDILSDDTNKITKNLPLVQGLLEALGGFGEKSIITDLLDGLFQLKRTDDVAFTLKKRDNTNFVGFSKESGLYLISNLFVSKNGVNTGIVPFILDLTAKEKTNGLNLSSLGAAANKDTAPYLTLSSNKANYKAALTSENKKQAEQLIKKLDTLLASLLKNTTINGFDLTATDSILSGVISAVSNYIGESNTNEVIKLIDMYLEAIVGDNNASSTGKVDKNKVYTSKKLSTLVISTYSLVENIADYLLDSALKGKDKNGIIADAICGIISPDAVGVRMSDEYNKTAKILLNKKNVTWADVKKNATDLDYGFSKGNKTAFYDALGESLGGIAAIIGVALSATYTDDTHTDNYYSALVYPIFTKLANATGATGVMSPAAFNEANASQQLVKGIITPLASILDQLYKAPVSFLLNVVKGLGAIAEDSSIKGIITNAIAPIDQFFVGVENAIAVVSPTLAEYVKGIIDEKVMSKLDITLADKNVLLSLITGIKIDDNTTVGEYVAVDSLDWSKLANAASPAEVLLIVYTYLVDNLLNSELLTGLVDSLSPELSNIIKKLSAGQIIKLLNDVLAVTQSPTEVYWTFNEYASKLTGSFSYPKTITASEASNAVSQLDGSVDAVFALLKDLGVLKVDSLGALVNDNLYTNKMLTTIATAIYGAIEKADINDITSAIGLDLSPAGFANILMDKSYGNTYSSAANTLKKAKSWSKVKTLNWGFKDGSSKAEAGFVNGIAAIARPINGILAVLLAEGGKTSDAKSLLDVIKNLTIDKTELPIAADSDFGCILNLTITNGVVKLVVDSNNSKDNSTIKIDLPKIINDYIAVAGSKAGSFGTNGYESAIIPILEAFMCDGVKTYKQYLKDYSKAKDSLLTNILTPIVGFIGDVVDAPFDTVTKVLPNVAYFIDSNGLTQAIGNLLAPITAKNGLLGALAKNGLDVDKIIKSITGKSLGKIITDALDINVKLNLELNNLAACNIQDIVVPLVSKLLKDKLGMTLPKFTFADIAAHGTIKTVKSAAKNDKGKFTTRQVQARQGEVLVAVLRYVGDVLIKNANPIKKLLTGIDAIKKNKTIANIITSVFNQIKTASADDIVRAVFYLLTNEPTDNFFDYSNFKFNAENNFEFGDLDEDFCRKLAPMLDGLVGGLLADKGGLNGLIGGLLYKDDLIGKLATGLYGAVEGVSLGSAGSLTGLLAHFDIDFSTSNVAALLTDEKYGKTYDAAASVIKRAGSWKKVKAESLTFGVTDRKSFENALCAVLRPIYPVLDVFLNDSKLNLANIASVPGSDCYTSVIVPLLEAFGCYNIKTQYQYRQDISKAYDAILLDVLDPLLDKVEDILYAPVEMVADMLPNLALFFANDGLLQVIDNLLTPVTALLDALRPIVDVNDILHALGFDINKLTAKAGLNLGIKLDIYDLKGTLEPLIGAENVVSLLNKILGIIKIKGAKLGIELPNIDWLQLASHGEMVLNEPSQVATIGPRMYVKADQDETLIAVLRFVIDTINYKGNYDAIVGLLGGLLGGLSDSIAGVIDQVLGMLKGDSDTVIKSLVELLQTMAG